MTQDLVFLAKIIRALGTSEPRASLRQAIAEMGHQAREPDCRRMNRQWQAFVREIHDESWLGELENLCHNILTESLLAPWPQVLLDRNFQEIQTFSWMPDKPTKFTMKVTAGQYRLRLTTGRVLWDEKFSDRDLIWQQAQPGRPLAMAAAMEEESGTPARELSLLEGAISLRVYAGLEEGRLEIIL